MPVSTELFAGQFHMLPDGTRMRYALFDPPQTPRATIFIAPGRRDFIEKKYTEMGADFLQRGFRVIIAEWRGHGLSTRFWSDARRQREHITDFDIYLDDLDSFYEAIIRTHQTGPLLVCGHSMGGHLLLRWLAEHSKRNVKAAIVIAPMLALGSRAAHAIAGVASRLMLKVGRGEHYGPWQHDYDWRDRIFLGNPLTHDRTRFALMPEYFKARPELMVGGVTWAWLSSALKSMRGMRRAHYLEQVAAPVLAITGSRDRVTPARELARYMPSLPRVTNIVIPGARHDVMNELETFRAEAWRHIDGFLGKVLAN